jgi:hypothetical protein
LRDAGDLPDGSVHAFDAKRCREIATPDEEGVYPLYAAISGKCSSAAWSSIIAMQVVVASCSAM